MPGARRWLQRDWPITCNNYPAVEASRDGLALAENVRAALVESGNKQIEAIIRGLNRIIERERTSGWVLPVALNYNRMIVLDILAKFPRMVPLLKAGVLSAR